MYNYIDLKSRKFYSVLLSKKDYYPVIGYIFNEQINAGS